MLGYLLTPKTVKAPHPAIVCIPGHGCGVNDIVGIDEESSQTDVPDSGHRHKLPASYRIVKTSMLGGLHHEYSLVKDAA